MRGFERKLQVAYLVHLLKKRRPMINVISQSLGLDIANINAYAKFYQNIPNGLRVIDIFHKQAGDKFFINCPVSKSNV